MRQVKSAAVRRELLLAGVRLLPSAGGIEWRDDVEGRGILKLPELVQGGAVVQNNGADVLDIHEHKQQAATARDRRWVTPRAAPM